MWPSDANPAYGSFVRDLAQEMGRRENVHLTNIVLSSSTKGLFVPFKYVRLLAGSFYHGITAKPDIIYCHYLFPTGFIGYLLKRVIRKPLVVTSHGSDVYLADRSNKLSSLISSTLDSANTIITVSNSLAKDLKDRFPAARSKIEIINCGVDQEIFKPGVRSSEGPSCPVILFVGTLNDNKNILKLVEAVAGLDIEYNLRIVGKGPLKEVIVSKAKELGISNKIELVGAVNKSDLPQIYREADLLVMPSLKEAFGLVALEAMACGTPVIVSNRGGLAELVDNGSSGLCVDPDNIDEIRDAISKVITDERLRKSIISGGLETASNNSVKHQVSKLVELFEDLRRS